MLPPTASPKLMPPVVAPAVTLTPVPLVTVQLGAHGMLLYSSLMYPWLVDVRR